MMILFAKDGTIMPRPYDSDRLAATNALFKAYYAAQLQGMTFSASQIKELLRIGDK